jgi:IS30 family transposase
MSYSHLSIVERGQLETLSQLGWSARAISCQLGRHHGTISREIKRSCAQAPYEVLPAQKAYHQHRAVSIPIDKFIHY